MVECYKPLHGVSNLRHAHIVTSCLAVLVACSSPRPAIDGSAREYVRLARAGERHDAAFIEEIAAARQDLVGLQEIDGRRAFLLAQLAALERRARFLGGRQVSIRDEASALGLSVPAYDARHIDTLRRELDVALPGTGPLVARLAAHRRKHAVSRSQLESVAMRSVAECQARTPATSGVRDAGIELRYVIDRPWPAFTTYRDDGTSLVEIRRDVAWLEGDLLVVLCHETYPGHHLQNIVWDDLRRTRGWAEFAVMPPFTPHAVMAERAAIAATSLVVSAGSRLRVTRILEALAPLAAATAASIVDGEIDRATGVARLRDDLLMPDPDGFLAFVERYRSMAVAYVTPLPDVRDWPSYFRLLRSPARLVAGAAQ